MLETCMISSYEDDQLFCPTGLQLCWLILTSLSTVLYRIGGSQAGLKKTLSGSVVSSLQYVYLSAVGALIELISIEELSTRVLELFDLQKVSS